MRPLRQEPRQRKAQRGRRAEPAPPPPRRERKAKQPRARKQKERRSRAKRERETPLRVTSSTAVRSQSQLGRLTGAYRAREAFLETTTRQAEALNPAIVSTAQPLAGLPLGIDVDTGAPITGDPHILYEMGRITSPNVVVLGDIGSGKSSFAKTAYATRQVAQGKYVAVFDRKDQQGQGEYDGVAKLCGAETIRFDRRGATSINLLDPLIATTGSGEETTQTVGQDTLLEMVAGFAHGELSAEEHYALRAAHRAALATASAAGKVATIREVINHLYAPSASAIPHEILAERGLVDTTELSRWGMYLAMDLDRFVTGDLSGLIDGETSDNVNWHSQMLVFDTSELPEASAALALVMALVATFLTSVWSSLPGRKVLVLEEGYHTTNLVHSGQVSVPSILRSLLKRGRGIGLAFVTILHHISDIPKESDSMSLIREAQIVHIYRQSRADDRQMCFEVFQIPTWSDKLLSGLRQGVQIIKIGTEDPQVMEHIRSPREVAVTVTDKAMLGDYADDVVLDDAGDPLAQREDETDA